MIYHSYYHCAYTSKQRYHFATYGTQKGREFIFIKTINIWLFRERQKKKLNSTVPQSLNSWSSWDQKPKLYWGEGAK